MEKTLTGISMNFEQFGKGAKKGNDGKRSALFSITTGTNAFGLQPKFFVWSKTALTKAQLVAGSPMAIKSFSSEPSDDGYVWLTTLEV